MRRYLLLGLALVAVGCTVDLEHPSRTCTMDSQCSSMGTDAICDRGFCVRVACEPTGERCEIPGGLGVCASGARCTDGRCVPDPLPIPDEDLPCNGADDDCDGREDGDPQEFDFMNNEEHCGGCNRACGPGLDCCGGVCVNTATDSSNCSACGSGCGADTPDCCGSTCTDFQEDEQNCGSCGRSCGDTETCCGGVCIDDRSDADHCGGCGLACGGTDVCCDGMCHDPAEPECQSCDMSCLGGTECCQGSCVDYATDPNHCSAEGTCPGATCGADQFCCAGGCVDEDPTHCGGCDPCEAGQLCCGGVCADPTSAATCGACDMQCTGTSTPDCCPGGCVDLATDRTSCGTCGNACPGGQDCVEGICCPAGNIVCGGVCVNASTNRSHCGRCGNMCTGLNSCVSGVCRLL